jgi:hypothetical protein
MAQSGRSGATRRRAHAHALPCGGRRQAGGVAGCCNGHLRQGLPAGGVRHERVPQLHRAVRQHLRRERVRPRAGRQPACARTSNALVRSPANTKPDASDTDTAISCDSAVRLRTQTDTVMGRPTTTVAGVHVSTVSGGSSTDTGGSGRRNTSDGRPSATAAAVSHCTTTTPGTASGAVCGDASDSHGGRAKHMLNMRAPALASAQTAASTRRQQTVRARRAPPFAPAKRMHQPWTQEAVTSPQRTRNSQPAVTSKLIARMVTSPSARRLAASTAHSPTGRTAREPAPGSRLCCCQGAAYDGSSTNGARTMGAWTSEQTEVRRVRTRACMCAGHAAPPHPPPAPPRRARWCTIAPR